MAKPTTYEFPPLKVSPLGGLGVAIDPATEEEQWALRQLLYKGDYPEEVLQDIFRDPGPYYRKMAQGFLRNNPYVKLEGPPTERTLPEGYEYIQPEEEAEIEIYDPRKPYETVWSAEDIAKGWRQPRSPARTPPVVRGPHDIEAIEDEEIKEVAKTEKAVTVIEEKAQEEREWWKRNSKEKLIEKQFKADQAYIAGEIDRSQLAAFNVWALKGMNLKTGKGEKLKGDDLALLYSYTLDTHTKMIPKILKADFSNLDSLKDVSNIRYVNASDFDDKPYEYLRDLMEQAELIKMMQLIDPNHERPKTLSDIRNAQAVLNKLKFSGKLTTMQHAKYSKPLNILYKKIKAKQEIDEAGGPDAYRQKAHESRAEAYTRKAFYNQEEEMAKFENLRQRVFTVYVARYLKENPGQYDLARRRAIKKINKLHPMPTLNYRKEPKIGASMIREGGWIWNPETNQYRQATDFEKLKGMVQRQPIGSGFPLKQQRAIEEARKKQAFVDEFGVKHAVETGALTAAPAFQRVIYPEVGEAFTVFETPFATMLRNLGLVESAVEATMVELTPAHAYKEGEPYRLSSSGRWIDQFTEAHSKGKFFPEYFETVLGDVVGKDNAWWGGLSSSFGLPLTGYGTLSRLVARPGMRALGVGSRTVGALVGSSELKTFGKELRDAANFFNWVGEKAKTKRLAKAFETVMPETDVKRLVKKAKADHAEKFHIDEWLDLFKEKVDQGSLNQKIVERIAERNAGVAVAKGLIDSKRLTEETVQELLQNKDMAALWLESGQNIDTFTGAVNKIWKGMKDSSTDAIAISIFNQAKHVHNVVKNQPLIKGTQEAAPWLEPATRFDKEFNDALFVSMINRLELTDNEMVAVFKRIAQLPKEERTAQKMAEVLKDIRPLSEPEGSVKVWPKSAPQSVPEGAERLGIKSLSPADAKIADIMSASEKSLGASISEKIMDYLPWKDVVLLPGGVFQRASRLRDRRKALEFKKRYEDALGTDKYKANVNLKSQAQINKMSLEEQARYLDPQRMRDETVSYTFSDKAKKELIKILTKEISISDFTASAYYQDLINKLSGKPIAHPKVKGKKGEEIVEDLPIGKEDLSQSFNSFDFFNIKNIVARRLNKEIFGAFDLKDLGRQAETAISEMPGIVPAKGGVLGDLGVFGKGAGPAPRTSFGMGDLTKSLKDLVSRKPYPVSEPTRGSRKFNEMLERVNSRSLKVTDDLKAEIQEATKRTKDPLKAVDEVVERTWVSERMKIDKALDANVTRHFNGSYKEFVLSGALKKKGTEKSLKPNVVRQVKKAMREDPLANEEELFRKWAQAYNAFIEKRSVWENLINRYYGISLKDLQNKNQRVLFDTFMKSWSKGLERMMDPHALGMLNPSLTNLHVVIKRIEDVKEFKAKGLITTWEALKGLVPGFGKKFGGKRATSAALLPWVAANKRAAMVDKEIGQYIKLNPTEVISGVLNPLSGAAMLDPKPLHAFYKKTFDDLLKINRPEGSSLSAPVTQQMIPSEMAAKLIKIISSGDENAIAAGFREIEQLPGYLKPGEDGVLLSDVYAEAMAKAHLAALDKVSWHTRRNLLMDANKIKEGEGIRTLYPPYQKVGMTQTMMDSLSDVLKPLDDASEALLGLLLKDNPNKKAIFNDYKNTVKPSLKEKILGIGSKDPAFMSGQQYTIFGGTERALNDMFKRSGWALGDSLPKILKNNASLFQRLTGTEYFKFYGDELKDAMENLNKVADSKNIDFVADRLRNDKWGRLVLNTVADLGDAITATTVSGMLGGWILPGMRYLGVNIWSAPLIATTTVGKHGLGTVSPQMHRTASSLSAMPVDKVVFTSKDGIPYTAGELRYLMGMTNRGFSQEQMYFAERNAKEIMRSVNLTLDGMPQGKLKSWFQKNYNPTNMTIWSQFAMKSDQHFRDTVFLQALKNGLQPAAAAKIAQRSMLDYGAPSKDTKKWLGRFFLFWRFKLMMATETANDLSRAIAKDRPSYAINSMKYLSAIHRDANTWYHSDDDALTRMAPVITQMIGEKPKAAVVGPAHPTAEVYQAFPALFGAFSSAVSTATGNWDESFISEESLVNKIKDGQWIPAISLIRDAIRIDAKHGGSKFRDDYIPALRASGQWEWAKKTFNLEVVDRDRQKWDGAAYGDRYIQYKFGDENDEWKFAAFTFLATVAGLDRNIRDYGKTYMAATDPTTKRSYGRYADPNPLLYALGIETSIGLFDPQDKGRKEFMKMVRELKRELKQGEPIRKGDE